MFSHSCAFAALYSGESSIGSVAETIKWRSANYQILRSSYKTRLAHCQTNSLRKWRVDLMLIYESELGGPWICIGISSHALAQEREYARFVVSGDRNLTSTEI
jgi:hypothetical protein